MSRNIEKFPFLERKEIVAEDDKGKEGKKEVKENVERFSKTLERMGEILDKNKVEYYIGGGIGVYLIADKEFDRKHHDIDIFIPHREISKFRQTLQKDNFEFWPGDTPPKSEKMGRHLYGAYDSENQVKIEITSYEMEKLSSEIHQDDFFDKQKYKFRNTEISTITPEYLYWLKIRSSKEKTRREKDKRDIELLKPHVNQAKFQELENLLEKLEKKYGF